MRVVIRGVGWAFIVAGAVVALYLVYSLYVTGLTTSAAQEELFAELEALAEDRGEEEFSLEIGELDPLDPEAGGEAQEGPADPDVAVGDAVGVLEFYRPSESRAVVLRDPVVVVEGVTDEALRTGPGRYPGTAYPGQPGNFAVAGHRTTYGQPFWALDELQEGDEIRVTDREGRTWVYDFVDAVVVTPDEVDVLRSDVLGAGESVLTLTTCHPRWSQRERLVVHAELASGEPVDGGAAR